MIAANTPSFASMPDLSRTPTVDQVGVEERVDRLTKRSIKKASKIHALKLALSMIDLTTLEGADSPGKVRQMCYKAAHLADNIPDLPHVAAVCVYPALVKVARAQHQSEAEFIEGLLLEEGIPCMLRRSRGFEVAEMLAAGPRDVLVPASGAQAAREALAWEPPADGEKKGGGA